MGCVQSKPGRFALTPHKPGKDKPLGQPISRDQYYRRHGASRKPTPKPLDEPAAQRKPEDAISEEEKSALKVLDINFNVEENAQRHHTEKYEITEWRTDPSGRSLPPQLVVRRGEPFDILIKFDRAYDTYKDDIKLVFTTGKKPRESKGTQVTLMLSDKDLPRQWGAKLVKNEGQSASIRIYTPPNCQVAKWNFKFDTIVKKGSGGKIFRYTHPNPFYMIFNPWCTEDKVFMPDNTSRDEYVLNDKGRVYRGTAKQISAKPWNFGQFEDFMLDCVMYLLDKCELSYQARGDPVKVARKISALANAPDDAGVLVGNWSGDYSGGTSPLAWVGSVAILEQYWKTLQPVKFGQCWVFSGVVTTICRVLGLPARSTTNFASAHDCDGSITIDNYWDTSGTSTCGTTYGWLDRTLPPGYGGWQAIDATPQELSDGVYCAGPASVEAIKNGLVNLPYDANFIFAEVNADKVHWIKKPDNMGWATVKEKHKIGKNITTKALSADDRQDVTNVYKFKEDSQQERMAVWRAIEEGSTRKDIYQDNEVKNMKFDLIEKEDTMFGESFDVTLKVTNDNTDPRDIKATLTATVVYYTGVAVKVIKSETYNIMAPGNSAGQVTMSVSVDDYLEKVVDMCNIRMEAAAHVEQTDQHHCESDDFRLLKPDLDVKAPAQVKIGTEYQVEVTLKNPLPKKLTKCEFQLEGASLQRPVKLKHDVIPPNGVAKVTTKLKAMRVGEREIIASFDSKELSDVDGSAKLTVVKD
ncbi:hypothetical protein LSH36_232g01006 [Paralvinella palmiformis]|uniref:Transglutaminase-like domain-containing protein n=1 Tax=Paralvinella palmiformis TaxID=53620 RepID=A0AAD9JN23_9ANNE|nr:hypothetical protein LSH36_232g01006 [Paralvinella palmiformis]